MAVMNKLQDNGFYSVALVGEDKSGAEEMTDTPPARRPPVDIAHPAHNPFDIPRPRSNNGRLRSAIASRSSLHGIIGFYLWQWKFKAHYQIYSRREDGRAADQAAAAAAPAAAAAAAAEEPAAAAAGSAAAAGRRSRRIFRPPPPLEIKPRGEAAAAAPPVVATPAPPPPRPTVISNPDWLRKPSGDDMADAYPDRAQRMGIGGRVELSCEVTASGT